MCEQSRENTINDLLPNIFLPQIQNSLRMKQSSIIDEVVEWSQVLQNTLGLFPAKRVHAVSLDTRISDFDFGKDFLLIVKYEDVMPCLMESLNKALTQP